MKLDSWLLLHGDAGTIYSHFSSLLPGRLDRNALDALQSLLVKYCNRRTEFIRDVRISWLVARPPQIRPLFRRAAYHAALPPIEYEFAVPPEYPSWIEISWDRGFGRMRISRAVNLRIPQSTPKRPPPSVVQKRGSNEDV